MAQGNPRLIEALRQTARRLETGAEYRWTHMGSCNCGHLAQTVTGLSQHEIHRLALERAGDWSEQAREYCPASGYPMDHLIETLLDLGLTRDDLVHLERLDDRRILQQLLIAERDLDHRRRHDVVRYMRLWADLLEREWVAGQDVPDRLPALETAAVAAHTS